MKIGQISHAYPPHIGGIENYVQRLKHTFSKSGNDVTVYTTDLGISKEYQFEKDVYYCKTDFSIIRNPFSVELFRKLTLSSNDIYHLHGYEFFSTLIATKALKNKPKVLTQHGTVELKNNIIGYTLNYPYHPVLQNVLNSMDKIIVLGGKDKRFLLRSFDINPKKIVIIPNGIDASKFKSTSEANARFVKKYHLVEDSFRVLFVGRLVSFKNAHKLLYAIKNYVKVSKIEIIVVGKGNEDYLNYLKSIRDQRIHILGEINFSELVVAYNISDLFVLLSDYEGLPTVLLEAMASGLPILSTPVGDIPEVIKEGINGYFIRSPVNEKELAQEIEYIYNLDAKKIKENNTQLVRERFNWDLISSKIFDVYREVTSDL
ncbi:glycosyltransferase family 4 protein [Methanothrix sp.]|uniref:glycosyltransferase family 4 protein n=1 Tax=Methanothrix sp. TaxID=90426 RepID=UPI003BB6E2B2